ncbi:MAG: GatB/YqeY domain-containing protein [Alphaproteobacteria bacterium]|nr:GatB/YqeY domain-containing protein [Alphaproteobacteria bacterium]MBR3661810.1 GatB/YqeY domain-containing protein [Alphaproteobacteria bacterium]
MLREDLQNELKNAMKNKDMATVGAIRLIIAGQKEKDVEARGKGLEKASDADLLAMMQTMIKQRNESIKIYLEGKRQDLADKEQSEIDVINRFLPKQMTKDEIEKVIKDIIAQTGASGIKDMGKIMGVLKTNYAGQMDFGMASGIIKGLLA